VQAANPESGTIQYSYDDSGNLLSRTNALNTASYSYDGLNRITGKTYSDGTPAVTYAYDNRAGRRGEAGLGGIRDQHDEHDELREFTIRWPGVEQYADHGRNGVPFSYTYDLSGALASETYPSGRTITNASFDAAGRVTEVSGSTGTNYVQNVTTFRRGEHADARQQPDGDLDVRNGAEAADGAVGGQRTGAHLGLWSRFDEQTGNILSETISAVPPAGAPVNASQAFSYDKVNRLTGSSESGSWTRNTATTSTATVGDGEQWGALSASTPQNASNYNAQNQLLINSAAYDAAGTRRRSRGT